MEAVAVVLGIAIVLFAIWYTYKQVEYFAVSVKLFRKIIEGQDNTMRLLLDIRDNTKHFKLELPPIPEVIRCPHCSTTLKLSTTERDARRFNCAKCGKEISM
jgi:hypothetical protein